MLLPLTALPACTLGPEEEAVEESEGALRALLPEEILGTIAYGETSAPVAYTKTPTYRAFAFQGAKGDEVEAWARSADGDARAWILSSTFGTIAMNKDAAPGTKDARVTATLSQSGTHYLVFRETTGQDATITVSLAKTNGGCALPRALTPTWENGATGRPHGPLVFDSVRNRLVVLGANGTSTLGAGGWSAPVGDPLPPGTRTEASIAYDSHRGRAVLFGGRDASNNLLGDTWEWDGATNTWTQITPPGYTPRARWGHALAYDAARRKTVLYGGYAGNLDQDAMRDTWTWDGVSWTRVGTQAEAHPEPRFGHHMAFDAHRGRVVLYGQFGQWNLGPIGGPNYSSGNTWEWDGSTWTQAQGGGGTFSSDDPKSLPMAYDTLRQRVVRVDLEGPRYQKKFTLLEWTGSGWQRISGTNGPSVDIASATSYVGTFDPTRGRFVLGSSGYDWKTKEFFFFEEPNRAPALDAVANVRAFPGDEIRIQLSATDADGHAVTYDVTPLPAGATIDAAQGTFRWTPTVAQAGSHTLTAKAKDGCAESTRAFTITVDHFSWPAIPGGAVKLGGEVQVPVYLRATPSWFEAWPKLTCVVEGHNPGKVTVTCRGNSTSAYAYPNNSAWFTPPDVSAPLEQNMTFALDDGTRRFKGSVEPLSDGTFKLHVNAYELPVENGRSIVMRTEGAYGTTDAYGVIDVIP